VAATATKVSQTTSGTLLPFVVGQTMDESVYVHVALLCDFKNLINKPGMSIISAFYHYMITFMEP